MTHVPHFKKAAEEKDLHLFFEKLYIMWLDHYPEDQEAPHLDAHMACMKEEQKRVQSDHFNDVTISHFLV
jgi:hypothetical protein